MLLLESLEITAACNKDILSKIKLFSVFIDLKRNDYASGRVNPAFEIETEMPMAAEDETANNRNDEPLEFYTRL